MVQRVLREHLVSHRVNRLALAAVVAALVPTAVWSCATCGCALNADAALGYMAQPGFRLSFEYDYITRTSCAVVAIGYRRCPTATSLNVKHSTAI